VNPAARWKLFWIKKSFIDDVFETKKAENARRIRTSLKYFPVVQWQRHGAVMDSVKQSYSGIADSLRAIKSLLGGHFQVFLLEKACG
jgi:hypothetical protein